MQLFLFSVSFSFKTAIASSKFKFLVVVLSTVKENLQGRNMNSVFFMRVGPWSYTSMSSPVLTIAEMCSLPGLIDQAKALLYRNLYQDKVYSQSGLI